MKYIENKLGRQLLVILVVVFDIIIVTVAFFLPRMLRPIYETGIYNTLKSPIDLVDKSIPNNNISRDVAYLYVEDDKVYTSKNYDNIVNMSEYGVLRKINKEFGNFEYKGKTYYYYTDRSDNILKVAITNETYLSKVKSDFLVSVITIFLIAFALIAIIMFLWSMILVKKIAKLKAKIDNIDNENFNHNINFKSDDEIKALSNSIEDMRLSLKEQEEYKNSMYQNISHDFKTPLTVIKSYVEAVEDGVEDKDKALAVIKEQTDKLEKKVYSLLYLNKLEYLKETKKDTYKDDVDIKEVITSSVEKFKHQRNDVTFTVKMDESKFTGTFDLWETIIDNILNNFIRYAKKEIRITVKGNKITLFNDGPNIDENLKEDLFNPFRKGIKGQFGLGLSIVKKTLILLNYDISIENNKNGVSFVIKRVKK